MVQAIALPLLVSLSVSETVQSGRTLTVEQGRQLVLAALSPSELRLAKLEVETEPREGPRFISYMVVWAGPARGGSVVVGFYAVDPQTADVFHTTSECDEVKNKKLVALQRTMRKYLQLTPAEYRRMKTKGPFCED